jgi:hypothetical protein
MERNQSSLEALVTAEIKKSRRGQKKIINNEEKRDVIKK